jgi:hypothetical protein
MVKEIEYTKAEKIEDSKIVPAFVTTIKPKPPFYLFVPSVYEIPKDYLKKMKGKAFALGSFFDTDEEAEKDVKEAGYKGEKVKILEEQGYLVSKKKLNEVIG